MILDYTLNKLEKRIFLINDFFQSSLDTCKKEILEEIKKAKYNVLEDMVYRRQLTYG